MKMIGQFLRLIRWPNLVFIALTQFLFHFCVVLPSAYSRQVTIPVQLSNNLFYLLCLASVSIAGAGYIINDYFDINIDEVNKPDRMVLNRLLSRRWALIWHMLLSMVGVLLSLYVSYKLHNWTIVVANLTCVILLWVYSTTYKRKLLIGNILISALTAWVILVLLVAEVPSWLGGALDSPDEIAAAARLWRIAILYAGFAFIISLVREVIKDIEDMEGDRRDGCKTMPIVWGVKASKVFAGTWLIVLIIALLVTQVYVLQFNWWWSALFILLLVVAPLAIIFRKLMEARIPSDFTKLSTYIKGVMLTGIASMAFFLLYTQ